MRVRLRALANRLPAVRRAGLSSCAAAALLLAGCSSDGPSGGDDTMKLSAMRSQAVDAVRQVSGTADIQFSDLHLSVDSCNDDGAGNSYQASVTGRYTGAKTKPQAQQMVAGWSQRLRSQGWEADGTAAAHNGTVLGRGPASVTLYSTDPNTPAPAPPNFEYLGGCHPLSDDDAESVKATAGDVQDILEQVR